MDYTQKSWHTANHVQDAWQSAVPTCLVVQSSQSGPHTHTHTATGFSSFGPKMSIAPLPLAKVPECLGKTLSLLYQSVSWFLSSIKSPPGDSSQCPLQGQVGGGAGTHTAAALAQCSCRRGRKDSQRRIQPYSPVVECQGGG